jgi:methionyl-tRNA synthetase
MLLSAGLPLPTAIYVHDYLTIGGAKISKSAIARRPGHDPAALAAAYGPDAVRWWLLRGPRTGDADFTLERLIARARADLANGLGSLVSRVAYAWSTAIRTAWCPPPGTWPPQDPAAGWPLRATGCRSNRGGALARPDFRAATAAGALTGQANRCIEDTAPWRLARSAADGDAAGAAQLDAVLAALTGPAGRWPWSWRRSSPAWPPGWPRPAPRAQPAGCPHPSRCTRAWTPGDRCPVDRHLSRSTGHRSERVIAAG